MDDRDVPRQPAHLKNQQPQAPRSTGVVKVLIARRHVRPIVLLSPAPTPTPFSMETREANLSSRAAGCLRALESCCSQCDVGTRELVKQQLDRFSLWINNTGAFAGHYASLDYRLREAHNLADALRDRLDILNVQICRSTSTCSRPRPPPLLGEDR